MKTAQQEILDLTQKAYPVGSRVRFEFFPNHPGGVVDRIDTFGRVWVKIDAPILDMRAGDVGPVSVFELRPA